MDVEGAAPSTPAVLFLEFKNRKSSLAEMLLLCLFIWHQHVNNSGMGTALEAVVRRYCPLALADWLAGALSRAGDLQPGAVRTAVGRAPALEVRVGEDHDCRELNETSIPGENMPPEEQMQGFI